MKCPNCGKEMKKTTKYVDRTRVDDGFWTETYIAKLTRYSCIECRIKCIIESESCQDFDESDYDKDDIEWKLPKELKPIEKQINYAEAIGNRLGLDTNKLVTKHQYWEFINKNQSEFKNKTGQFESFGFMYTYGLDEYDFIGHIPGDI